VTTISSRGQQDCGAAVADGSSPQHSGGSRLQQMQRADEGHSPHEEARRCVRRRLLSASLLPGLRPGGACLPTRLRADVVIIAVIVKHIFIGQRLDDCGAGGARHHVRGSNHE